MREHQQPEEQCCDAFKGATNKWKPRERGSSAKVLQEKGRATEAGGAVVCMDPHCLELKFGCRHRCGAQGLKLRAWSGTSE